MKRRLHFCVVLMLAAAVAGASAFAQAKEKKSRLAKGGLPMLAYVNLDAELGLKSEMLRGFGLRADEARREANVPALAGLAVQLGYAEELAGRQAKSCTAAQLLRAAQRIVEERQSRSDADAVILAAGKFAGGAAVAADMKKSAATFATARGVGNFVAYVKILNKSDRLLDVYVDGKYVGSLYSGDSYTYSTGNGTTGARVNDAFGSSVAETFYLEPEETFTWTIQP